MFDSNSHFIENKMKTIMKRATTIFFLFVPLVLSYGQNKHITVICTNDLHGALEPLAPDWAEGNLVGGISYLAGYANTMKIGVL